MEKLHLSGDQQKIPEVVLDREQGVFSISGKSLPEDAKKFYDPILAWLKQYEQECNDKTTFDFNLEHVNTASSMMILAILLQLKNLAKNGKEVLVNWHSDDDDMYESGIDFSDAVDIPFQHIKTFD